MSVNKLYKLNLLQVYIILSRGLDDTYDIWMDKKNYDCNFGIYSLNERNIDDWAIELVINNAMLYTQRWEESAKFSSESWLFKVIARLMRCSHTGKSI